MKSFLVTVDTEGDNLWQYKEGDAVLTENAKFLSRFQYLCDEFGFKPVWLTNYEMAQSADFAEFVGRPLVAGHCEIGIHIHAWNNPPLYNLERNYSGNPYLIEYPDDVMLAKFKTVHDILKERFGVSVKSHRSGRWAMDGRYFRILEESGVICDCSYTPGISWKKAEGATIPCGSDYSSVSPNFHMVGKVLEVPATVRHCKHFITDGTIFHKVKTAVFGGNIWMRPALHSIKDMILLADKVNGEMPQCDYIEFMIHSSELMPGGSPYIRTNEDLENMYFKMKTLFRYVSALGYEGETLENYTERHRTF